jgi:hypothetical protein
MMPVIRPPRRCLRWAGLALGIGTALQACTVPESDAHGSFERAAPGANAEVPSGAIQIGDQLYQVPIGAAADGCPRYRLYSPTKLVAQAIYYRDPAGGFTPNRRRAACPGGARD